MKKILAVSGIIVLFVAGYYLGFKKAVNGDIKRTKIMLGTSVEIIFKKSEESNSGKYFEAAFGEFRRIDELFSAYMKDNPIDRFNNSKGDTVIIEHEIYDLLRHCNEINTLTEGGFDVTIGNVTEAWKFNTQTPEVPKESILKEAMENSGWGNIELVEKNGVIKRKMIKLNFGAIAKGYAVDRAFEIIKSLGAKNFLINAGGEIRSDGGEWEIGIQDPRNQNRLLYELIPTKEFRIATSGDYENFFESAGVRYHHILNPKTGYPATGCRSVTVIAGSVEMADALATGIFIMGWEKGLKLVKTLLNVECLIIDNKGEEHMSQGFKKYIRS